MAHFITLLNLLARLGCSSSPTMSTSGRITTLTWYSESHRREDAAHIFFNIFTYLLTWARVFSQWSWRAAVTWAPVCRGGTVPVSRVWGDDRWRETLDRPTLKTSGIRVIVGGVGSPPAKYLVRRGPQVCGPRLTRVVIGAIQVDTVWLGPIASRD